MFTKTTALLLQHKQMCVCNKADRGVCAALNMLAVEQQDIWY